MVSPIEYEADSRIVDREPLVDDTDPRIVDREPLRDDTNPRIDTLILLDIGSVKLNLDKSERKNRSLILLKEEFYKAVGFLTFRR